MDEPAVIRFLTEAYPDANVDRADGATFFSCDDERTFPFATIVTADNDWDHLSNLDRPGVFRLNVGVGRSRFEEMYGLSVAAADTETLLAAGFDFTALDTLFPHPMYGQQGWISVLDPSDETMESIRPLLDEAHEIAVERDRRRAGTR